MNILNQYIKLVEFLGLTLGPDYEIVLYDVRGGENTIIAIANGHITGRGLGSPLSQKNVDTIDDKVYIKRDFEANYNTISSITNKLLRSSTLYIKDNNELIGILCINFDDSSYAEISKQIMELCHPHELIGRNNFEAVDEIRSSLDIEVTIEDVAKTTINTILEGNPIPSDRLTKNEKLQIVKALNDKGLFQLKNSVKVVAKLLHSSEATVYRYLSNIKNDEL